MDKRKKIICVSALALVFAAAGLAAFLLAQQNGRLMAYWEGRLERVRQPDISSYIKPLAKGDFQQVLDALDRFLAHDPGDPELLALRNRVAIEQMLAANCCDQALEFAGTLLAADPGNAELQAMRTRALADQLVGKREYRKALELLGRLIAEDPGNAGLPVLRSKVLVKQVLSWIPALLRGARITIALTACSMTAGLIISLFIALGKMSKNIVVSKFCTAYTFFFRGTPLLMQIYFIYYALPMISPAFLINTGSPGADRFIYAFIAYSLNMAAYLAEIIRAAIQSIDKGQFEASRALGLSYAQTMRLVVIPQSIRRLIPPVGNEFILMLKDVSLVSMIALVDITRATRTIESSTRSPLVYIPAMILYLIITAIFSYIFRKLEKKYSAYE